MSAEVQTERLLLRRFTESDAEAYWPLVSHPEIVRHTGAAPATTLAEARALLLAKPLRDYATHGYGRMACIEKASGRLVGFSGLKYLEDLGETDVGYRFLPEVWGRGYATESAAAVMRAEAAAHGLVRIVGLVEPANAASVQVLRKLGLRYERQLLLPDHPQPVDLYAVTLGAAARPSG